MSYTYVNGIWSVTTDIRDGFKRFHNCNAQARNIYHCNSDGIMVDHVLQFISYNTEICQIVKLYDYSDYEYYVWVNEDAYSYSRTTTRQFNRWINELARYDANGIPIWMDASYIRNMVECATPELCLNVVLDDINKVRLFVVSHEVLVKGWR